MQIEVCWAANWMEVCTACVKRKFACRLASERQSRVIQYIPVRLLANVQSDIQPFRARDLLALITRGASAALVFRGNLRTFHPSLSLSLSLWLSHA